MSTARKVTAEHLAEAQKVADSLARRIDAFERDRNDPMHAAYAAGQSAQLQPQLAQAKQQVAELERALRRFDDEEQAHADGIAREVGRRRDEERAFWFRRFHTSLALAHGAGFAAVASKLFDSNVTASTAAGAWYPMAAFACGMMLAGLIPVALFRETTRTAWSLAIASATLFLGALAAALTAVWLKAGLVWPW